VKRGDAAACVLALAAGAYPLADGLRAALLGDYFAPGGQLGPWAAVVQAAGVAPRSALMHAVFVALGLATLLALAAFALRWRPGRAARVLPAPRGLPRAAGPGVRGRLVAVRGAVLPAGRRGMFLVRALRGRAACDEPLPPSGAPRAR
jgi:hypothetical protein